MSDPLQEAQEIACETRWAIIAGSSPNFADVRRLCELVLSFAHVTLKDPRPLLADEFPPKPKDRTTKEGIADDVPRVTTMSLANLEVLLVRHNIRLEARATGSQTTVTLRSNARPDELATSGTAANFQDALRAAAETMDAEGPCE